nr:hypothetical protein [Tanacetum cinerariifolium]
MENLSLKHGIISRTYYKKSLIMALIVGFRSNFFYDHVSFHLKCKIDSVAGGKLRNKNANESWEIIENLYDHEGWNDIKEFAKHEGSDKIDVATGNDIEKHIETEIGMQAKEAKKKNEAGKEEMTEYTRSDGVLCGGLIPYQAYGNSYAMTGRKACFLEDEQIPNVGVFSTWMAFRGNTHDLGSFREEMNEITNLHQILEEVLLTTRGDDIAGITRRRRDPSGDGLRCLVMASGCGRINEDLESFT